MKIPKLKRKKQICSSVMVLLLTVFINPGLITKLQQQAFASHSSRSGQVQDQGVANSFPGLQMAGFSLYLYFKQSREAHMSKLLVTSYKNFQLQIRGSPHPMIHLSLNTPRSPPNIIASGDRVSHMNFWGHKYSIYNTIVKIMHSYRAQVLAK